MLLILIVIIWQFFFKVKKVKAILVEIFFSFTRLECTLTQRSVGHDTIQCEHNTNCVGPWVKLGREYSEIAQHITTRYDY